MQPMRMHILQAGGQRCTMAALPAMFELRQAAGRAHGKRVHRVVPAKIAQGRHDTSTARARALAVCYQP